MFLKGNPIAAITFLLLAISMFIINMLHAQSTVIEESAKLLASDGVEGDFFGFSVAISGDTVVVGAGGDDDNGIDSGSADIFERDQGGIDNWGQVTKLLDSDGAAGDRFGFSVAISGNTVVVGAVLDDDNGINSGSAYVFERDQGGIDNWGQVTKLLASDGTVHDFFGFSVAISGDTVVVGVGGDDDNGIDSGSTYVYERNQGGIGNWGQVTKLLASDGAVDDFFGFSGAISGDTVVVGALQFIFPDTSTGKGAAYAFSLTTDSNNGEGPSAPSITTQPASQEVEAGSSVSLSVAASGDDLTYQWYTGNSGNTAGPIAGATSSTFTISALTQSTNFWVEVTNAGGSTNSDTAVITVAAPSVPLVLVGTGDIAGENIMHPNGNIFDQILLTGESIRLQARPNQITRVSFMDETEDIVQVEFSGAGSFTVTLDPATFLPQATPPRYNQAVEYVTGKPSVVIDGADANTFFSIFTVGSINAVNQALFPEGQVYDAKADVTLVEVINSTGIGGMQLSNTVFSGSTGKVGVDARGVPIAVRLTVGDIEASGDAVPHLLFGEGSFTVAAGNSGLRITGGDLLQTNGVAVVIAESGSTTTGFETLISQNNFKSDNTPQPTQSIAATFVNADSQEISVTVEEVTIE